MKTVVNRIDLGMTRIAGYTLYDELTKEFQEITPKGVKYLIVRGQVNGLKLVNGEIELDTEGFNIQNLMVKSAVGKFRPLNPDSSMINSMYSVVRVITTDNGILYEIINNRCARVKVTAEHLKILIKIGYVAGVKINTDEEIEIYEGVTIEEKLSLTDNKLETIIEVESSSSEIIFDNLDDISKTIDVNIAYEETSMLSDNTDENKLVINRKSKKK